MLGVQRVGVEDSFFDLGGDSLSAIRVIAAISTELNTHLAVRTLFHAPNVRSLRRQLDSRASEVEVVSPVEFLKRGYRCSAVLHSSFEWGELAVSGSW